MELANDSLMQQLKMEHYRLHCVEAWPDSPHKQTTLAGIHSGLERLQAALTAPVSLSLCMVCAARRRESTVLKFPAVVMRLPVVERLAA